MMTKPIIGIAAIITICVVVGSFFAFWWSSWSVMIPVVASVGGMIVFLGLWIEKEADEATKNGHLAKPVDASAINLNLKSEIGWWILMAGIFVEIVTGSVLAAHDIWVARQTAAKIAMNDPRKQPITFADAFVWLESSGTNLTYPALQPARNNELVTLGFGQSEQVKSNQWSLLLVCKDSKELGGGWYLEFGSMLEAPLWNAGLHNATVESADRWDVVVVNAPFLPPNTKVLKGELTLFLNSEKRVYPIPPQIAEAGDFEPTIGPSNGPGIRYRKNPEPMIGPSNSVGVRVIPFR